MTERSVEEVGQLLSRRVGLRLDPSVRGRLARAVRDEAERCGEDEGSYVKRLESDPERLQRLLNRVTVQETSFFRDPGQFAALATHVLPRLHEAGGAVQVWSAGCSNGQEPYSLAMTLAESPIEAWHVTATDVSTDAVARTQAARYRERELRGLSAQRRAAHLVPGTDGTWEIAPSLRQRVTVLRHNLAADPPPFPAGACQIVFCRNVLIYFGHDDVVEFLDRVAARLSSSGFLFLGYSESLWQVTDRFQLLRLGDAFVYQPAGAKRGGRVPRATAASPPAPVAQPRPRTVRPPAPPTPDLGELMAEGEAALGRGDHAGAVTAFRKAVFLDSDHALAHLNLGLALEVLGEDRAARRAYAAARAALARCETADVESMLEGYHLDDLIRLLDRKVADG